MDIETIDQEDEEIDIEFIDENDCDGKVVAEMDGKLSKLVFPCFYCNVLNSFTLQLQHVLPCPRLVAVIILLHL